MRRSKRFDDFFIYYISFNKRINTEKFSQTLKFNIIPVVLGYANYSDYLPKSTYIDALDFGSPKTLAEYMIYLAHNKTAYNSYFAWKQYMRVDD